MEREGLGRIEDPLPEFDFSSLIPGSLDWERENDLVLAAKLGPHLAKQSDELEGDVLHPPHFVAQIQEFSHDPNSTISPWVTIDSAWDEPDKI